ncbi:MAG: hypothetical protein RL094_534 [Candidatus Parcubacteria bacterium]|jgi:hypothetical protein
MQSKIYIQKEDGSKEEFQTSKLKTSLIKSGADEHVAESVVKSIVHQISEHQIIDTTASDIYKKAFHELKERARPAALRYSLRRSLMEFGPTGFPFEVYVTELFKAKGFEALTGQVVFGSCVPHEVDVVAWNQNKLIMAEVKYHNEPSGKTDLKVALYVKARYEDLASNVYDYGKMPRKLAEGWLITNTKFTETAIKYGECNKLNMMSWDYPLVGNLRDMIEETKLHPVTALTTITPAEKQLLITHKMVLCRSVYNSSQQLKDLGFSESKIVSMLEEIGSIMNS